MSTKNVFIFIIFNSILFTFSCQSDQATSTSSPAEDYLPNIYSRYLVMENEFKIEVTFTSRKDSKYKNQPAPGELFFQDKKLIKAETRYGGTKYMIQLPQTEYLATKTIIWKDGNKVLGEFRCTMSPIYTFEIPQNTIDIDKGFRLAWEGEPLSKEEFLNIQIAPEIGDLLKMNRLGPTDGAFCNIVPQQLSKLKAGSANILLVKNKRINVKDEAGNLKCLFFDEYHLPELQLTLKGNK